ncbi:putative arylalkylamine n-acetyltransferase [Streptococcus sp. DD10]|uniref:GNAT family N-acetyltransferase n=1 Tax=Streptococcus sp. DD10 TaxID=1777878 RepID=UPI0007918567|nr:GNAT family N-acetyltransferase [Streptococcus sp. DD10]KXT73537.1 putative arylalkylamine n-acetyltransferase [Streptococcus sp. DD10]
MNIRQAKIADLEAIYAIEIANFSVEEAISKDILAEHIRTIKTSFLLAEEEGEIVGYIEGPVVKGRHLKDSSFFEVQDFSHEKGGYISITSLSIAQKAQSQGLGSLLLQAMKNLAIKDSRQGLNLTCHDYLIAYYEKQGFINEGLSASTYAGETWYDMVWENPQLK